MREQEGPPHGNEPLHRVVSPLRKLPQLDTGKQDDVFCLAPSAKHSRYYENGHPTRCYYCGQRFDGSAIRDSQTNRYFCSDACLKTEEFIRFSVLPRRAS
jgi:hypothetical protein